MADEKVQTFEIPKTCKGGVVVNEGPDFYVEVQDVPVPEIGRYSIIHTREGWSLTIPHRPK